MTRDSDTHRMAGTTQIGPVRSMGSAGLKGIAQIYGSPSFISRTRNPHLEPPKRFEMTRKQPQDIII